MGEYGWRCRIALITPPDNLLIEPELVALAPTGVSIHSTRLREINLDTMAGEGEIEASNYGMMPIDAIAYACNISSFHEGPGSDEEIADRLCEAAGGTPATTASTAMVAALNDLDARSIAVVSPYDDENALLQAFLEGNGFEIAALSGLGLTSTDLDDATRIGEQSAADTYRRVKANDTPDADAVLVTATNLASITALEAMEADIDKPVVSANQAILWHALVLAGVDPVATGGGTLLAS